MNWESRFKLWEEEFDNQYMTYEDFEKIFALGRKAGLKEALEIISLTPYVTIAAAIRQRIEG